MSQPITLTIPHRLGKKEATRRLKAGLESTRSQFGFVLSLRETWEDDDLAFQVSALGQSASGKVTVADDNVVINVALSGALGTFSDLIRSRLRKQATLMLEKK
jgi:hypothetical protein